ncbi:glycosyltransferase [Paenibacillus sp. sgz500958]|uniref:tetratricopeptide repeat-containing glycosyltransferase family 2 protein n=1 Tax=Paenibacillus sp. sgz500958 TaxID=3242475 RepID=UPI0036D414BA
MITISLCLIVKDEQDTLERCLSSAADLVEEIIIVDTGSTDNTKAIARKYTDKIYDFEWVHDFAAARNYAFSLAGMDYIMWLDADDVLRDEDRKKLRALKASLDPEVDSVTMNYNLAFDDHGNVTASLRRNRLVKRSRSFRWIGAVHEYLEVAGKILNSDIAVTHSSVHHDSDRNLLIYERRLAAGEAFPPRDLYYFANELLDHQKYERAIHFYEQFLGTRKGWIEDNIAACGKIADCYHGLGDEERGLAAALRSLQYDTPRAEFCCRIGYYFLQRNNLQTAVYWYTRATEVQHSPEHWGFRNLACSTWLPHLQLCVCYDRLGQHELAHEHNEAARKYRPNDARVLQNKSYLEGILFPEKGNPVNGGNL